MKILLKLVCLLSMHLSKSDTTTNFNSLDSEHFVSINASEFETFINSYDLVMIDFHAPWCGHCKKLEPTLSGVATSVHSTNSKIKIAKMDTTTPTNQELAKSLGIDAYPTLAMYKNGQRIVDYSGSRKSKDILEYLQAKINPEIIQIETIEELESYTKQLKSNLFLSDASTDSKVTVVLAVFPLSLSVQSCSTQPKKNKEMESVVMQIGSGTNNDVNFDTLCETVHQYESYTEYELIQSMSYHFDQAIFLATDELEIILRFGLQEGEPTILVFTDSNLDTQASNRLTVTSGTTNTAIMHFIAENSLPCVIPYSKDMHQYLQHLPVKIHSLVFLPDTSHHEHQIVKTVLESLAPMYRGRILFLLIDSAHSTLHQFFEVTSDMQPKIITADMRETSNMRHYTYLPETDYNLLISGERGNEKTATSRSDTSVTAVVHHATNLPKNTGHDDSTLRFSHSKLKAYWDAFMSGLLEPTLKSENELLANTLDPLSMRDMPGIVTQFVGNTFKNRIQKLEEPKITYFMYFYTHWCAHCKAVEPIIVNLALAFRNDPSIRIAKMDLSKNDVYHPKIHISGYPAFYLFIAGEVDSPIEYDSERSLQAISKFINEKMTKSNT